MSSWIACSASGRGPAFPWSITVSPNPPGGLRMSMKIRDRRGCARAGDGSSVQGKLPKYPQYRDVDIPRRIPKTGRLGVRKDARQRFGLGHRAS